MQTENFTTSDCSLADYAGLQSPADFTTSSVGAKVPCWRLLVLLTSLY